MTNVPFDNISALAIERITQLIRSVPIYIIRLAASATADFRYGYNRVDYSAADQLNSRADQYSARIQSGPSFNRVNWNMSYSQQNVIYDNYPNSTFKSAQGQLGYFVASSLNINGTLGYEENKYDTASVNTSGRIWNVGFDWAPSPRTSLSATYGRRFYGDNYSGSFKHNSRLTQWVASYAEEITSVRDMQLANHTFGLVDSSGNVTVVNVPFPELTSETFIHKAIRVVHCSKVEVRAA